MGWHYAHHFPEKVKSLSILGIGVNPALDWVSYYYLWRNNWDCSQEIVLAHLAKYLFGSHSHYYRKALVKILERGVTYSLSRHSLYKKYSYISLPSVQCQINVIGSKEDKIVPSSEIEKWQLQLKKSDNIWECPTGNHFFHYFQPQLISEKLLEFLCDLDDISCDLLVNQKTKVV